LRLWRHNTTAQRYTVQYRIKISCTAQEIICRVQLEKKLMSSSRGESVTTYVPPEIKRKLEAWAKKEQRSISFLVAQLIINAVGEDESNTDLKKD
jgi:hypothetical protein